jgi:hypothetical protein
MKPVPMKPVSKKRTKLSSKYWLDICPNLHITERKEHPPPLHIPNKRVKELRQRLRKDGYFDLQLPELAEVVGPLRRGVVQLHQHGWPATFISIFDEAWEITGRVKALITTVTGNRYVMNTTSIHSHVATLLRQSCYNRVIATTENLLQQSNPRYNRVVGILGLASS